MIPAAVRAKLKSSLLMLSSDFEGERQAANAAIDRILKANNLTWYDLAGMLDDNPVPASPPPASPTPEPRLRERIDGRFEITADDLLPLVQAIREHVHCDSWTDEFLAEKEDRAIRWGTVILTEKQINVLTRLINRIPT